MPALYRIRQATADDIDDLLRLRQVVFDLLYDPAPHGGRRVVQRPQRWTSDA